MQKLSLLILLLLSQTLMAQNVGIGTTTPLARLHITDSSVLFSASGQAFPPAGNTPITGSGRRMMWFPNMGAFRVGYAFDNYWDADNMGYYSFATGYGTKAGGYVAVAFGRGTDASGDYAAVLGHLSIASGESSFASGYSCDASGTRSTAMGDNATAVGYGSVSMGYGTQATGQYSIATGFSSTASGAQSTAMGDASVASGDAATAMGEGTIASGNSSAALNSLTVAKAFGALSVGSANDIADNPDPANPASTDRILQVGIGNYTSRANAITVLRNGNTGIGTVNPATRLHVMSGASGYTGGYFTGMALENNGDLYFNLISPNNNETAILFGKTADAASGGIVYNNAAQLNGMQFRTNGNTTRMVLTDNGYLGVGVTDPAFRLDVGDRMRIRSATGYTAGLWLNNDINTTSPAFIGMRLNDEVGFFGQTGTAGWRFYVNTTTGNGWMQGTLTQNSDRRLKKNITPLQNSLQKIVKLGGYHYHWKNENADTRLQTGVMAQEVQKLFPELVSENKEGILAVNYSGLIPVMIESIKEQQKQIDELKKLVERLLNK